MNAMNAIRTLVFGVLVVIGSACGVSISNATVPGQNGDLLIERNSSGDVSLHLLKLPSSGRSTFDPR